jgi:hypothetical protein
MRISIALICLVVFSTVVYAVEPVDEQQVMLYYIIPLDADKHDNNNHQFGLRFDQTTHNPGDVTQISTLESRPAALDFRMGYKGVQSLKIHGVDYASQLIARAAEGEEAPADVTTEPETTAETPAAGGEGEQAAETEEPKEKKTEVQEKIDALPFGVIIGVLLGVGFLVGVGG